MKRDFTISEEGKVYSFNIVSAKFAVSNRQGGAVAKFEVVGESAVADVQAVVWCAAVPSGDSGYHLQTEVLESDGGFYFYSHCQLEDLSVSIRKSEEAWFLELFSALGAGGLSPSQRIRVLTELLLVDSLDLQCG